MLYTRKQLTAGLRLQLSRSTQKAAKALVFLYNAQTNLEQDKRQTIEDNGKGFTIYDATVLSGVAKWYLSKGFLTESQAALVRRLLPKYAPQLLASSIERGLIVRRSRKRWEILDKAAKV